VTPTSALVAPVATRVARFATRAAERLLEPVDVAWLAAFRILFGLALAVSMLRFLGYGWVDEFFVEPTFHFKYWGFEWVEPLPGPLMHALFALLALLALGLALGLAFRVTATAFALGLAYVQLLDVATYLNHYYLATLLAFLLAASPAHRTWSVDAWLARRRRRGAGAETRERPTLARGWLWLFRVQVGSVYAFAGLAKAQSDWLVHAQPLRIWLGAVTELPLVGPLFTLSFVPLALSWCGFLFDSSIVPLLLWKRTRRLAYALVLVFHAFTSALLPIGMFPVIMILSAPVFFSPSWPRRLLRLVHAPVAAFEPGTEPRRASLTSAWSRLGVACGVLYCVTQLVLPLRFVAYGGNVLWDEQGMRFSWRVMLRAKGGETTFHVRQKATGREFLVSPERYLTLFQASELSSQPDLILQLAHHVRDDLAARGLGEVEVRAESRVSLNGRRSVPFIDPKLDLTREHDGLSLARLVLPPPTSSPPHTRPVL
jgi:vitamin K-dependent gamma-carboxylase